MRRGWLIGGVAGLVVLIAGYIFIMSGTYIGFDILSLKPVNLKAQKGKVVLLHFFSENGRGTRQVLGAVNSCRKKYPDRVALIGVDTDETTSRLRLRSLIGPYGKIYPVVGYNVLLDFKYGTIKNLFLRIFDSRAEGELPMVRVLDGKGGSVGLLTSYTSTDLPKLEGLVTKALAVKVE